jgi:hypothetical protein
MPFRRISNLFATKIIIVPLSVYLFLLKIFCKNQSSCLTAFNDLNTFEIMFFCETINFKNYKSFKKIQFFLCLNFDLKEVNTYFPNKASKRFFLLIFLTIIDNH